MRVGDGETLRLAAGLVQHDLGAGPVALLAYNGELPGPRIRATQGTTFEVLFRNDLPWSTTVHWHGIRLDPAYDGVPGLSQDPVPPGGEFRYVVRVPDEGVYWYHAHVREDMQQDLGLYGFLLVEGERGDEAWPREVALALDDVLVEDGRVVPYSAEAADHALMGRFGNVVLVDWSAEGDVVGRPGERLRLHLLNAASARPFRIVVDGADRVELVGLDGGFLTEPTPVEAVVLGPAERATLDVVLPRTGDVRLVHRPPSGDERPLGLLRTEGDAAADVGAPSAPHARARESLEPALAQAALPPAVVWDLDVRLLDPALRAGGHEHHHGDGPSPIEWEDAMGDHAAHLTPDHVRWVIRDPWTLRENGDIDLSLEPGGLVNLLVHNKARSAHPMHHTIHLHGVRFLVQSVDGVPNPDPAWKDVVLVPVGARVLLTVDTDNPGAWMFHCHIPEHMEAGMMGVFRIRDGS